MSSLSRKRKKIRKGTCGSCGESHIFGTYRCPQCDLKSNCPAELEIHMDDVHSCNLEYFCPFCDVMCSGYPELEQHVIMGHGFTIVEAESADVLKRKKISVEDVSVNDSTVKLNKTKTIAASSSCEGVNIVTNDREQPHRQNNGIIDTSLPAVDLTNVASIDEINNCTMNQKKVIAAPKSLFGNSGYERNGENESQRKNNEGIVPTSTIPVIDLTADVDDFSVNPSLINEVSVEVILNNKQTSNKCDANSVTIAKLKPDESCLTPVGVKFANNICNKSIDKDKELNESAQVSITKTKDAKSTLLDPGCDRAVLTPVLEINSEEFGVPFQEKSSEEPPSTSGHSAPSNFETQTTTIKRRESCSKEKYHKHEKLVVSNWWQKMAKNKRKSSEMATKESADEDAVGKSSVVEGVISSTESQMNSLTLVNLKNHERSYSLHKMRDTGNSNGQQPTPVVDRIQKRSLSVGCSKISETKHELCIEKTNASEEIACSSEGELLKTKQSKSDKESMINQLKKNFRQRKHDSRKSLLMCSINTPNSFTSSTGKKTDSEFECDANSIESSEGENSTAKNQCQNEKSKYLAKEGSSKAVKSKRLEESPKRKRNKLSDLRKKFSKANPFQKKKKIENSEIVSDIPVYSDKSSSEDSCTADDMEYDADDIDYIKVNIDKSFQCTKCNVRLGNMFAIRSHCKELHLPMRPYCCSNCNYAGKSTAKLTAHFKKRHFSVRSVIVTKNSVADIQHTAWNTIHSKIIGKIGLEPSTVSTEFLQSLYSTKKSSKKSNKAFPSKRYNFLKLPVYKTPQSSDAPLNLKRSTCNSETISSKKKNKFDSLHAPVSSVGSKNDSAVGSSVEIFFPSVFPASGAVSNTSVAGASTDVSSTSTSTPATAVISSSSPTCHSRPKSTSETSPVIQSPILPQNFIIVQNQPAMKQNLVQMSPNTQMSQTQTSPSTQLTFTLVPQTSPLSAVPFCLPPVVTMASQPFTAIPISMISRGVLIPQGPLIQSSMTPDRNVVSTPTVSVSSSIMSPCVSQQEKSVPTQSLNEKISIARLFPQQKNSSVKKISKEKTGSVENSAASSSVGENVTSKKIKQVSILKATKKSNPSKSSSNAKKLSLPSDDVEIVQETLSKVDTVSKPTNTVKPMLHLGENQYGSVSDGHPCPLCDKIYSQFKLVVFHVVIDHLFFEPYICNCTRLCSMKFRSIYPLLKHMCQEHAVYPQIFCIDEPVKLQQMSACQKLFTRSAFEEHQQHEKKLFAESIVIIANSVHLGEMAALRYRSTLTSEQVPNVNLSRTPNNTGTPMNVALPSGNSDSELSLLEPSVSLMCSSHSVERYFSNLLYSTASKQHTTTKQSTAFFLGETSTHSGPIPSTRHCSETLPTNVRAKPTTTTRIQISAADESTGALPPVMQSSETACLPMPRTAVSFPSSEASTSIQKITIQTQPDVATASASAVTSNSHCEKISQDQNGEDIKTPCYSVENTGMYRCLKCHEICIKFSVLVNHIKVCHMTSLLPFECFLCLEKFSLAGDAICHMFVKHHIKNGRIRINLILSGLQERRCHNLLACPEYKSYTEAYKIFLKTQLCKQSSEPPDKVICKTTDKLIFASTSMPNEFAYLYVVDNSIITVCQLNGQIFERCKGLGSKRSCSQSNAFDDVERRAAGLSYSRRFSKEELTRHLPAHVADSVEFIELNEDDNNEPQQPIVLLENMTARVGHNTSTPCEMSKAPNNEQVDDSRYKCSHCDYMSGFFECLLSHICSEHSKWKPYLCLKCTTAFPSLFQFFLHISNGCWTREMSVSFELYRLQKAVVESCCRLLGNDTISEKVKLKFRDWVWFTNDKTQTENDSAALYHIAEHHYMSTSVLKYAAHIKEIWRWDIYKSQRKKNLLTLNTHNDWHFNIDVITPTMILTNKFISNSTLLPNPSGEQQIDSVHESARVDSCLNKAVEDIFDLTPTLSSDISENIQKRSSSDNSNESDTALPEEESLTGTIRCPMCKAIHSSVTMLMIHYQKVHLEQYKPFHCCLCDYCCQCLSDFILHVHYLHYNNMCKVSVHLEEIEKQDQAVLFAFEDCGDHFDIYVKFRTKFLAKYLKKIEAECNSKKRIDVYMVEEPITKSIENYAFTSGQHTLTFNGHSTFKADTTATKKPTNHGDDNYQYGHSSTVATDCEVITISDDVKCISSENIVVPVSQNSFPQPYNDIRHQTSDSNLNNDSDESIQTALNENGDRNISLSKETLNRKTNVADKNVELSADSKVETSSNASSNAPTDESSSNDSNDVQYLPEKESSVSFRPKDASNTDNNSDVIIIKENSKKSGENEAKKKEILLQELRNEVKDIVSVETKSSFRPKESSNTDNNSDVIIIKENSKKSGENEAKKKEILLQEPRNEVKDIVFVETKSCVLIKAFKTDNSEPSYEDIRKLISMLDMVLKPEQYIHCYFCKIRFNKVNKLQVHLKKQHIGLSPFSCVKCGYMATTREVIISHLSSVHDISNDDHDKYIVISECQLRKQNELLNFLMLIGFNLSKIVGAKSLLDHIPCKLQCPSVSTCKPVNSLADMQLHIFVNHVCCINDKDLTCCIKSCKKSIKLEEAVSHFHDHHPDFIAMFVMKPTPSSSLTTQFKQILAQVTIVSGQSVCNTQRYLYQVLSYYEKTIKK